LRAICARSSSFAAFISFAHFTTRSLSNFSSRERILPSFWSVFLNLNWYLHWLFGRFAGASDRELMVSPAFLIVQDSMKEVVTVKEKRRAQMALKITNPCHTPCTDRLRKKGQSYSFSQSDMRIIHIRLYIRRSLLMCAAKESGFGIIERPICPEC
jgi:hypothetical protein